MNYTPINMTTFANIDTVLTGQHYIEDLCKSQLTYIQTLVVKLAIVNVVCFFLYTILGRFKDITLLNFNIEKHNVHITINTIRELLFNMLILFNFYVYGYWFMTNNLEWLRTLPILRWLL